MKSKFSILLISAFLSISTISIFAQSQTVKPKAYLSVTFKGKALQNKELKKAKIADKLRDVLTKEGFEIIPSEKIEKHGETYLYLYVTLSDSLHLYATRAYGGGNYVGNVNYANKSYVYKSSSDVTSLFRQYLKSDLNAKEQSNTIMKGH